MWAFNSLFRITWTAGTTTEQIGTSEHVLSEYTREGYATNIAGLHEIFLQRVFRQRKSFMSQMFTEK